MCSVGVLWVGLLSAQQTVVVPDVTVPITVEPTPIEVTVQVQGCDSACMQLAVDRQMQVIAAILAEQTPQPASRVVRIGQGALVVIAGFMAWQLKRLVDKKSIHNDGDVYVDSGDVTIENNIPKHTHDKSGKSHR